MAELILLLEESRGGSVGWDAAADSAESWNERVMEVAAKRPRGSESMSDEEAMPLFDPRRARFAPSGEPRDVYSRWPDIRRVTGDGTLEEANKHVMESASRAMQFKELAMKYLPTVRDVLRNAFYTAFAPRYVAFVHNQDVTLPPELAAPLWWAAMSRLTPNTYNALLMALKHRDVSDFEWPLPPFLRKLVGQIRLNDRRTLREAVDFVFGEAHNVYSFAPNPSHGSHALEVLRLYPIMFTAGDGIERWKRFIDTLSYTINQRILSRKDRVGMFSQKRVRQEKWQGILATDSIYGIFLRGLPGGLNFRNPLPLPDSEEYDVDVFEDMVSDIYHAEGIHHVIDIAGEDIEQLSDEDEIDTF